MGSSLLIGGLGAILAFEARFVITSIQGLDADSFGGLLIAASISLLGIVSFLVREAFESRTVAFSSWWTTRPKVMSWVIFLALVLVAPLIFFVSVDAKLLCETVRWAGFALMLACAVATSGEILFGEGLSKGIAMTWWLSLMCLVAFVPLLDQVPSPR